MPIFDYKRKIDIRELGVRAIKGKFDRQTYLSLVGGVVGRPVTKVGYHIEYYIESFHFKINGQFPGLGKRKNINHIWTRFISDFGLQENDPIRIRFDSDCNRNPLIIQIEVPDERVEKYEKTVQARENLIKNYF